jgi:hypothetical protein
VFRHYEEVEKEADALRNLEQIMKTRAVLHPQGEPGSPDRDVVKDPIPRNHEWFMTNLPCDAFLSAGRGLVALCGRRQNASRNALGSGLNTCEVNCVRGLCP